MLTKASEYCERVDSIQAFGDVNREVGLPLLWRGPPRCVCFFHNELKDMHWVNQSGAAFGWSLQNYV